MALKIGEIAERGRVNLQTIRYYEREKLLPEPPRLAVKFQEVVHSNQTVEAEVS